MKNNILTLFSLAILLTAVSCSTSSTESASTVAVQESSIRSAPSASQEEEFNLLLARKWENESGAIFLDLKIDGSFEGNFDSDNIIDRKSVV